MKADIHPNYVTATVKCSCGNTFETRSTKACTGETCARKRFMGLVYDPGSAGQAGAYWYCFKCGRIESQSIKSSAPDRRGAA